MQYELLSPAGNYEKMVAAVRYGADAVYLSGTDFGLRAKSKNFSLQTMEKALQYLHSKNKKGYVTVNIYARNYDFDKLKKYIGELTDIKPDALIVSDPGIFKLIKDMGIKIPIHISTQANVTNYMAVNFWAEQGAERVILARELSKDEIEFICKNTKIEIEMFVHGAMCISHSGRCVLSNYFTGRDANKGECTHPCRWKYHLVEETRPGEYLPIIEDERGTYIYNSKDLCLVEKIEELTKIGVHSFKIEGRMKSVMYASIVTGIYRQALDKAINSETTDEDIEYWRKLLGSVSNREYTNAFYDGNADYNSMNYNSSSYVRNTDFLGLVIGQDEQFVEVLCRGKFEINDSLHFITPDMNEITYNVVNILDDNKNEVNKSNPNARYFLKIDTPVPEGSLLRRYTE
jgi:putative protease